MPIAWNQTVWFLLALLRSSPSFGAAKRVEEAAAVLRPRGVGELDPAKLVGEVLARGHVADLPHVPVGAAFGQRVGQQPAVRAGRIRREGDGAVRAQRVGVEQHPRLRGQRVGHQQHSLVLQAVVAGVEVAPALLQRHAEALEVPQLRQPLAQRGAGRDLLEQSERDLVLGLDPGPRLLGVDVLQPAIRVRDRDAVQRLDQILPPRVRVLGPGLRRHRRAGQGEDDDRHASHPHGDLFMSGHILGTRGAAVNCRGRPIAGRGRTARERPGPGVRSQIVDSGRLHLWHRAR